MREQEWRCGPGDLSAVCVCVCVCALDGAAEAGLLMSPSHCYYDDTRARC